MSSEKPFHEPGWIERNINQLINRGVGRAVTYAVLAVYLVWAAFPIYWLLTGSLKTRSGLLAIPPNFIPTSIHIENYVQIFVARPDVLAFIRNSILITISTALISVSIGVLASYALVRFDYPYKLNLGIPVYLLATRFMPPVVAAIPIYLIFRQLGLINTIYALILIYSTLNIVFVVWMMKGFFEEFPDSLIEAAIIDGHTHIGAFFKVVLPAVKPGILASTIFAIMTSWNELLLALIIANNTNAMTIPVGLASFITRFQVEWIMISVLGTISIIPVIAFSFLARDELIRGFSMGTVDK